MLELSSVHGESGYKLLHLFAKHPIWSEGREPSRCSAGLGTGQRGTTGKKKKKKEEAKMLLNHKGL